MSVDALLRQPCAWLAAGLDSGPVISSRIRLARNLKSAAFPGWAGEEECDRIWLSVSPVIAAMPSLRMATAFAMDQMTELDRLVLLERHLISREQFSRGRGSGVVFRGDETLSVMVNEEDHLRIQGIRHGFDLPGLWEEVDRLDTELEESLPYAFSAKLGYLTACPSNVGTGLRASCMLHLPGLVLMNEIGPMMKGMAKIGLAVRGLMGEGTEASGNMFQISNQMTLGETEEQLVGTMEQIVQEIVEHELNARVRLMERREAMLRDHAGRAYGILAHAHLLSSKEALDFLSGLRLGIDTGILDQVSRRTVDELMLLTQPGHLQKLEQRALKPKERDRCRASLVRARLAGSSGAGAMDQP